MAQKKKAKTKSKAKGQVAPRVLLFNLEAGTPKGETIKEIFAGLGVPVRSVAPERLGDPVGALAGMIGFMPSMRPYEGKIPEVEFMLFCGMPMTIVEQALNAMEISQVSVDCKAMLTTNNKKWPFGLVIEEVAREHEQMTS